jgi:hypothetical protein
MASDRFRLRSVIVRFRGISPASTNLWTQPMTSEGGRATVHTVPGPLRFTRQPIGHLGESTCATLQRMPRVMFSLDLPRGRRRRNTLPKVLARQLSEKFGTIEVFPRTILSLSCLKFKVNRFDFVVRIAQRKAQGARNGEWFVAVDPFDAPAPLANLSRDEQIEYARDLRLISDGVHAVLVAMPGVTRLRWFVDGWESEKPGVRTPAELPWHLGIPELCGAAGLPGFPSPSFSTVRSSRLSRTLMFVQRHPSLVSLLGGTIVLIRVAGALVAAIGMVLLIRFVAQLVDGAGLTSIWLGGVLAAACIGVGLWALNVLMLGYKVGPAASNVPPPDRSP